MSLTRLEREAMELAIAALGTGNTAQENHALSALRAALASSADSEPTYSNAEMIENYEIGKREGYEEAIQDLDVATGGDGEFYGSSDGGTVDVPVMKQRIIDRFEADSEAEQQGSPRWQPISSAPKGVSILVRFKCGHIEDAVINDGGYSLFDGENLMSGPPLHWMPLPDTSTSHTAAPDTVAADARDAGATRRLVMSKQTAAKEKQGYVPKAIPMTCANCAHFEFETVQTHPGTSWQPEGFFSDKNLRCGLGRFAVKKMGTCNEYSGKA
jgi:hypothetical protein